MARWIPQTVCPSVTTATRRRTTYLEPIAEQVRRSVRSYLDQHPDAEDVTLAVLSDLHAHGPLQALARSHDPKRLNQDVGLLVAQTLVDLYGADRVLTLRADDGRTVSTRRNNRPDLQGVERYTAHRVLPERKTASDRVVLDTTTVWKIVQGDRDALDLGALSRHTGRRTVSVTDGAMAELSWSFVEGRLPVATWTKAARRLDELLDPDLPVCPGGLELAAMAGLRSLHGVELEGMRTCYREAWRFLCSRTRPEELREPGYYDGPDGRRHRLRLIPLHIEIQLAGAGGRWDEWVRAAVAELASWRAAGEALNEEAVRRMIRLHLRMDMSEEAIDRLDLAVRAIAHRTAWSSWQRGSEPREDVEVVDIDPLFVIALPAVLCTHDQGLIRLARETGSEDSWRVMDPPALLEWLAREDRPQPPARSAEVSSEPELDPAEQQAAWKAWVQQGPQGPIDDGATGWP